MVNVASHLLVDAEQRDAYLAGARPGIETARASDSCLDFSLDFSLNADPVDPGRIVVFERRDSRQAVDAFRGSGPSADQAAAILGGSVSDYVVRVARTLM